MALSPSSPQPVNSAANHPMSTHSRNAMCPSIARNDGHELAAEKVSAKMTASPVSSVAKKAMLNWVASTTSSWLRGWARARNARPTAHRNSQICLHTCTVAPCPLSLTGGSQLLQG